MRILAYMHKLEIGGTQTNAIDLAVMLREMHGWETIAFAAPGPMERVLHEQAIPYIRAPEDAHPRRLAMRRFSQAITAVQPDLVHAWDWWQYVNAMPPALAEGIPIIVSDMISEDAFRLLPRWQMTTFGTAQLVDKAKVDGHRWAAELRPPVNTSLDRPGAVDGSAFRAELGLLPTDNLVVSVSRLAPLKEDSILRTMDVVGQLSVDNPVKYVVVGAGPSLPRLKARADCINSRSQRDVVLLAGGLKDPRVAYQAADLIIGMGGSALRAMAFEKPVVVVGEKGFARVAESGDDSYFLYYGLFGSGDAHPKNETLQALVHALLTQSEFASKVSMSGRRLVEGHYGLDSVASTLASHYLDVVAHEVPTRRRFHDWLRTVLGLPADASLTSKVASRLSGYWA